LKTDQEKSAELLIDKTADSPVELAALIQRPRAPQTTSAPEKVEGIVIGTLNAVTESGEVRVNIDSFGLENISAQTLVELTEIHLQHQLALGFQSGDPYRPIVLGLLHHPKLLAKPVDTTLESQELEIIHQGKRIVIEAEHELELRCGEAVILLTADGHIQLRGGYITSHADATQRIRGGSVQIN